TPDTGRRPGPGRHDGRIDDSRGLAQVREFGNRVLHDRHDVEQSERRAAHRDGVAGEFLPDHSGARWAQRLSGDAVGPNRLRERTTHALKREAAILAWRGAAATE